MSYDLDPDKSPSPRSASDRFHDHLDECAHCRANPFALCAKGRRLIAEAAADLGGLARLSRASGGSER